MFPKNAEAQFEVVESLDGGAQQRARLWNVPPTQYADGYNIDISERGVWKRRRGTRSAGTWPGAPGGFGYTRDTVGTPFIWAVFGSNIFRTTGFGVFDQSPVTNITLYAQTLHMLIEGIYVNSAYLPNQYRAMYGCQCAANTNTTEASRLFVFRGNQVTSIVHSTQQVSYAPLVITFYQGRLWKANDQISGDGFDLMWSELDDGLTYSPANAISVEPGIGGRITGLYASRADAPQLIVFKEHSIHAFEPHWGSSSALIPGAGDELDTLQSSLRTLSTGLGCIATRSIAATPGFGGGDVLYLSRDGVRGLLRAQDDSIVGVGPRVSENIPDWIARINFTAAHRAVATVYDNAYHLAVPLDGAEANSHILRLDLETGSWSLHNWKACDIARVPLLSEDRMYMQYNTAYTEESTNTGLPHVPVFHFYRTYIGDKDPGATTISYELQTRAFAFGTARQEKAFDRLLFVGTTDTGETHRMQIAYDVDFQGWVTMASLLDLAGPASGTKLFQRRFNLRDVPTGTFIRFRFTNHAADFAQPQIYYMDVAATPMQEIFDNSR